MRGEKFISGCNRNYFFYFATTNLDYKTNKSMKIFWNHPCLSAFVFSFIFSSFDWMQQWACFVEPKSLPGVSTMCRPCLAVILKPCAHSICWVADLWIKQRALEHLHVACHLYHHTCLVCIHSPLLKLRTLTRHDEPEGCTHHGLLLGNWPLFGCPHCKGWEEKVHG